MKSIRDLMAGQAKDPAQLARQHRYQEAILADPEIQAFIQAHSDQVSTEIIENSMSKLSEFKQEKDALAAGQPGSNPGFQPSLFLNVNYIDVAYKPSPAYLQASAQRTRQQKLDNRMMSRDVRQASLDTFDFKNQPNRKALVEYSTEFIASYSQDPHQAKGLYIYGPFGVGKTYFLGALANDLYRQFKASIMMIHYPSFPNEMRTTFKDQSTQAEINRIKGMDILVLDDLGAETNSQWLRDDLLLPILEYRMKESLPTFFTSNFSLEELKTPLANSRDGVEPVKADRILERIRYLADEFLLEGDNRRQQELG